MVVTRNCLRASGTKVGDTKLVADNLSELGKAGAVLMLCRTCGKKGDQRTSRCPYKDLDPQTDTLINKASTSETPSGTGKAAYVRVANLTEDTQEDDVYELFSAFGPVSRVYVATDQRTGMRRGFGFVNFVNKEDAEKPIKLLNGHGYDNLILTVEWATPSPK